LLGPGLQSWPQASAVLSGAARYQPAPIQIPASELLPAAERRRSVHSVKLALAVGCAALQHAERAAADCATVFTSSGADGETIHQICAALALPEREVSPTRFHNSVHNAPAGYWSIATQTRTPSTSLCCFDASFCGGLLEAAAQARVDGALVLLVAYDVSYPEPLHRVRPLQSFATAMVLSAQSSARALARLEIDLVPATREATRLADPELDRLRTTLPAARSLPLLTALARRASETVLLDYLPENRVQVAVTPC
jgi:Beta-ketoacyl synthase, N-terminal domain